MRTHPWAVGKRITGGTICTAPQWPAEHDLPIFTCIFTSVHISLGFRQVQFKQHKKHRKQKDAPFLLSAALHHFLLGKGNISDKGCSVGICNHKKVCLSTVASRLGLSLPQRCTATSVGSLPSEVYTMGSLQLWRKGEGKAAATQQQMSPAVPSALLMSLASVLSATSPVSCQ